MQIVLNCSFCFRQRCARSLLKTTVSVHQICRFRFAARADSAKLLFAVCAVLTSISFLHMYAAADCVKLLLLLLISVLTLASPLRQCTRPDHGKLLFLLISCAFWCRLCQRRCCTRAKLLVSVHQICCLVDVQNKQS